jgi:hypothetical protein
MLAHELQVRAVSDRGEAFGQGAADLIGSLGVKSDAERDMFERWLEDASEALPLNRYESAVFCIEARIAFYDPLTDGSRHKANVALRDAAASDMLADLAGDEADQIADYRAELERA